ARSNALVACSLRSSAYVATASWNRPVISENGSTTKITDTLAPRDFASANPCVTPRSASSDPSVGMRICRYMLHLPLVWTYRCLPKCRLGPRFGYNLEIDQSIGPTCRDPDVRTFETCPPILRMSVHRGRPEVAVIRSNRRE